MSVSRLIVYYNRFAPTTDRSYNLGLVTSIIEPSIAIIAACAPALRRLFTYFAPRYFSEGETYATYTNNGTYESRRGRSQSLPRKADKEMALEVDMGRIQEEDEVYDMSHLRGKESREVINVHRTYSVRTGVSENASQPFGSPMEPFNMLNQRQ